MINWVKDKGSRGSKSKCMKSWTKFVYCLTSPYAVQGGVQQCRPSKDDFLEFTTTGLNEDKLCRSLQPFKYDFASMGHNFPVKANIKKIRVAGRDANKISAVAHAYALTYADTAFAEANSAWTSPY